MGIRAAWRALWRGEAKDSAVGRLLALGTVGRPVWTPRRYDQFAEEGYRKNVIAYRCIEMVSQGAASVPWVLYRGRRGNAIELEDHPLLDLLRRPNPTQGGAELFESFFSFLQIAGNSYLEAMGPDGREPRELYALRPDRMRVIPGARGLPQAYEYAVGGAKTSWQVDAVRGRSPILHVKAFNPLDDWYGMSPIEAASFAIDQHNEAGAWNKALLERSGSPSGAFVYAPKEGPPNLSDEQFDRMKGMIAEQVSGAKNAGRPLLLEGGFDWKQMALSPKDMDWIAGKDVSAREVALAFGVPAQLVGIPDQATYANFQEARLGLWEETILPLLDQAKDALNNWLPPMFGEDLFLDADLDEVSALNVRREVTWSRVRQADFLTVNEKREAVGYEPVDGGDVILTSALSVPLGAGMGGDDEAGEEAASGEDQDEGEEGGAGKQEPGTRSVQQAALAYKLLTDASPAARARELRLSIRLQAGFVRGLSTKMAGALAKAGRAAASGFRASGSIGIDAALETHAADVERLLKSHWRAVAGIFGKRLLDAAKAMPDALETKEPADEFERRLIDFERRFGAVKVTEISRTTRRQIRDAILDGEADGEGVDRIAKRIRESTSGLIGRSRAVLIARTETHTAANFATDAAAKSIGVPSLKREWIAAEDARTRESHDRANGQVRGLEEPFDVGGASLSYPGDPGGPPGETINCRCVAGVIVPDDLDLEA